MKLLIIDDHDIVRKGIILALDTEMQLEEVREAATVEEGMKELRLEVPDITIVDIKLGRKQNGLSIIQKAKAEQIATRFVVLTSSSRKDDFIKAKALGVQGYILKDSGIEDLFYGLKSVAKGKNFYDSQLESEVSQSPQQKVEDLLTEREYEVFRALGKGYTNAQIAQKLYITENTVKKHISSILSKLEMTHRTEAALHAANLWRRESDQQKEEN